MGTIKLSETDWEQLIKGREFRLGSTSLLIEPLSIGAITKLTIRFRGLFKAISESSITADNIESLESLTELFTIIVNNAPEILEAACGLDKEDIRRLPLATGVCLLRDVIEVNMESQQDFVGALESLGKLIAPPAKVEPEEEPENRP